MQEDESKKTLSRIERTIQASEQLCQRLREYRTRHSACNAAIKALLNTSAPGERGILRYHPSPSDEN